jgi:LysM repeat protein
MRPYWRLVRLLLFGLLVWMMTVGAQPTVSAAPIPQAGDPVVVAAGDIANCSNNEDFLTGSLIDNIDGLVLALGDLAYEVGSVQEFNDCYAPAWGRHKARTRPVPGNHEYGAGNPIGYFTWWGDQATPQEPGCTNDCKGYYSFDVGTWHIIALNSEIAHMPGDPQYEWLRADLAAHPTACTLAYWHRPWFSSGRANRSAGYPFWQLLYEYNADVVLVADEHMYERFAPQTPEGVLDPARGVRQFTVGTGGAPLHPLRFIQPTSEVRNNETFGVLKLTLRPTSYDWEFIPIPGQSFTDSGSAPCNTTGSGPAPAAPTPVAPVTQAPTTTTTVSTQPVVTTQPATLPAGGANYTVRAGDTVSLIALRYGLDWRQLAAANNIADPYVIEIGQVIRLPGVQSTVVTQPSTAPTPVAVSTNPTTTTAITPARTTTPATTVSTTGTQYTVKAGDTLYAIALRNNTTWQALAAANGLAENALIRVGQVLVLPGTSTATTTTQTTTVAPTPTSATPATGGTTTGAQYHTVVAGDTVISIAIQYGVDWQALLQLNGMTRESLLQIGQRLRVR